VRTRYPRDQVEAFAEGIFEDIYMDIPVGFNHNKRPLGWANYYKELKTGWLDKMFHEKGGMKQLGTLGSGNHFIEIGCDESDYVWIVIHSGSRNVGHSTATEYMKDACFAHTGKRKAREGNYGFKACTGRGSQYITDMEFCLKFALLNRREMLKRVQVVIERYIPTGFVEWETLINRTHNHAEITKAGTVIHRKGATHAEKGMFGIIPGNMRDGSFIVVGKGDPNSLCSSSHGAGRLFSRKRAKELITMEDFHASMEGITAKVSEGTKDESPFAYKDISTVMDLQRDLVKVVHHIKPIINVKG
jgi:tRNA-splicing ligase RtcB